MKFKLIEISDEFFSKNGKFPGISLAGIKKHKKLP